MCTHTERKRERERERERELFHRDELIIHEQVSTPAQFVYTDSTWYDYQPTVIGGDGDGTVNLRSLHVCKDWKSKQSQPVRCGVVVPRCRFLRHFAACQNRSTPVEPFPVIRLLN